MAIASNYTTSSESSNNSTSLVSSGPPIEALPCAQTNAQSNPNYLNICTQIVYITLAKTQSLGLVPIVYYFYAAQPGNITIPAQEDELEAAWVEWKETVTRMASMWKMLCLSGCGVLLTASFAFFQIAGVNGSIYARTAAMSVIISAGFGAAISTVYLCLQANFLDIKLAQRWVEASNCCKSEQSFNFFVFLTLPFSLLAWSIIFSTVTYFTTIFTDPNQIYTPSQSKTTVAAILLCVLAIFYMVPVIGVARLINNEAPQHLVKLLKRLGEDAASTVNFVWVL